MTKAYVLRTTDKKGKSRNGFQWPLEIGATVTAPDWNDKAECGSGLHGLLDGVGDYFLLNKETDALWWVVEVEREECVWIDQGKVKFKSCTVVYFGDMARAMTMVSNAWIKLALAEKSSGESVQAASKNYSQLASSGYGSQLASSGDGSQLASSGDCSQLAASGDKSIAVSAALDCTASVGKDGCIALAYWDEKAERYRIAVGYEGEVIKSGVTYTVSDGKLVEAE